MLNSILCFFKRNNLNKSSKVTHTLLFKEQFKYLKTTHSYHLVDPSPWPIVAAFGAFMLTSGGVLYMHKFIGGWNLFVTGFTIILYVMYTWWRDVIREATFEDQHTVVVQKGLRLGMILFIVSEIMFFFAFFWAFFHSSIAPVHNIGGVWPPKAISTINTYAVPLTNTFLLLSSGATVTWAHHAILVRAKKHTLVALIFTLVLATLFTGLQGLEYVNTPFSISDGIYGSCFFLATGFHGFHVFVGTIALLVSFFIFVLLMKSNSMTILFFIALIAACATSEENDVITSDAQDIKQEKEVDIMLQRDQEKIDSMERILLKHTEY